MKKLINYLLIISILLFNINIKALTISSNEETANNLVKEILNPDISYSNTSKKGTVYKFSDGKSIFGIDAGIILDTSGKYDNNAKEDTDLKNMIISAGNSYGGHTSSLQFDMIATGNYLNFNYVFLSNEFDQNKQFNDVFGLFVKVNDGEFENIAKIDRSNNTKVDVNITNLRAGISGSEMDNGTSTSLGVNHTLFTEPTSLENEELSQNNITANGISTIFNANKKVKIGDKITVKFVIADVGDTSYDSYVLIEKGSLSFEKPGANINYKEENIYNLEKNTKYKFSYEDKNYTITTDSLGKIPLVGKDDNNVSYNFIGKTITIVKKAVGNISDSESQQLSINERLELNNKEEIKSHNEFIYEEKRIILKNPVENIEYSINGKDWFSKNEEGYVVIDNLKPGKKYSVYVRVMSDDEHLASNYIKLFDVKTISNPKTYDNLKKIIFILIVSISLITLSFIYIIKNKKK